MYDVKLENGRRTHCFWMTAEQVSALTGRGVLMNVMAAVIVVLT